MDFRERKGSKRKRETKTKNMNIQEKRVKICEYCLLHYFNAHQTITKEEEKLIAEAYLLSFPHITLPKLKTTTSLRFTHILSSLPSSPLFVPRLSCAHIYAVVSLPSYAFPTPPRPVWNGAWREGRKWPGRRRRRRWRRGEGRWRRVRGRAS